MNSLQEIIVSELSRLSLTDREFYNHMREVFTVKLLCEILEINRNRYNYLSKRGLLYLAIVKLRGESK